MQTVTLRVAVRKPARKPKKDKHLAAATPSQRT
jgi:hypothetical protein